MAVLQLPTFDEAAADGSESSIVTPNRIGSDFSQSTPVTSNAGKNDDIASGGGGGGVSLGAIAMGNMMMPQHAYSSFDPRFQQYQPQQQQMQQILQPMQTTFVPLNSNSTTSNFPASFNDRRISTTANAIMSNSRLRALANPGVKFANDYNSSSRGGAAPLLIRGSSMKRGENMTYKPQQQLPQTNQSNQYEDYQSDIDAQSPSLSSFVQPEEVALTTDLITLSVHEALTFDGVELALHPDLFENHGNAGIGDNDNSRIRPGDLVEIRVWCIRPGMEAEASHAANSVSSVLKSNNIMSGAIKPVPRSSPRHSRNASLATMSSNLTLSPDVGNDNGMSPGSGYGNAILTETENRLVGENILLPDDLMTPTNTSSSLISGAASNLFWKSTDSPSLDDASLRSHSRDNSTTTNISSTADVTLNNTNPSLSVLSPTYPLQVTTSGLSVSSQPSSESHRNQINPTAAFATPPKHPTSLHLSKITINSSDSMVSQDNSSNSQSIPISNKLPPQMSMGTTNVHRRYHSNLPPIPSGSFDSISPLPQTVFERPENQKPHDKRVNKNIDEILLYTHFIKVTFIMPVSEGSLTSIKSGARTQVSLLKQVADLHNITTYDTVTVTKITKRKEPLVRQAISADYLTITFKDQFVSRGEMYSFQKSFVKSWVYEGKRLSFNGIRTVAKVIRHGDKIVRSALISDHTKLTFRSRSARIIWLVQMSSEMWDYAPPDDSNEEAPCQIYFYKFIDFARRLFDKWNTLQLSHNLTVVFFSRTYIRRYHEVRDGCMTPAFQVDSDGRMFVDHYKIVLENEKNITNTNLIYRMKKEFMALPKQLKWDLKKDYERTPSTASQGNVLEAINITLNLLHLHYIDRDLNRTGNSIVIITPGNGVFEIEKNLAGITKQRMMDNGIGSDVLSLSLPPLHVAPIFLYKEKGTPSSEEEIPGFDGWKSFFEVPHWMNLSFVDYDNDEESTPMNEIDENDTENPNQGEKNDNKANSHTWSASNGFLKREIPESFYSPEIQPTETNPTRESYKQLIAERGFKDILRACRPKFRGEYGYLPEALTDLLQRYSCKFCHGEMRQPSQMTTCRHEDTSSSGTNWRDLEWGAVDFENDFRDVKESEYSFGSFVFDKSRSKAGIFSLHLPPSLDGSESSGDGDSQIGKRTRQSSFSSSFSLEDEEDEEEDNCPLSALTKFMDEHDENVFSSVKPKNRTKERVKPRRSSADSSRSTVKKKFGSSIRNQSTKTVSSLKGGIESSLDQFDLTNRSKGSRGLLSDVLRTGSIRGYPDNAAERLESKGSPLMAPISRPGLERMMSSSLDRQNVWLRPNSMSLGKADAILTHVTDGFNPLASRIQRMTSFHLLSQSIVSKDEINTPAKKKIESRLGPRRKSQWDSPANLANESSTNDDRFKTAEQEQSHRYRRQRWVLNPFRQEDEEEVLANRTHNRRRWSHVFPLGEDEFKRHAGPNWKSLCQPAILPLTIDFHPSPKELADQKLFSIKQYSVVLPSNMEETMFKSHKELLDELLMQRMRQDYQIVPRAIIQQSARRDSTDDSILEATLSMGHKIHRLAYNPSTDSVDVVQYYARFAEDETPQTYHYFIWSSLKEDYVSVLQTFTKYTLPYKWNELDMIISGDPVTNIVEGMRQPRISFVIIPDLFVDSDGENEYLAKFQRFVEYLGKIHPSKDEAKNFSIEVVTASSDVSPKASSEDKRFTVDLRKKRDDKYEWMELVHDSNCDTRRTFRLTIQWLVCVASKIDQQAQLLHRRCSQYGLKLVSVPHHSCLKSTFMNPFTVSITRLVHDRQCVDAIEEALTNSFDFVYDGRHLSDPNEFDCLNDFKFNVNKWSMKKRAEFTKAQQYLNRTGTLFVRLLRDTVGSAVIIFFLNQRHILGDEQLLQSAREAFHRLEQFIEEWKIVDDNDSEPSTKSN